MTKARLKAIKILEAIADYCGDEEMFDCDEKKHPTRWYDLEDMIVNIIKK